MSHLVLSRKAQERVVIESGGVTMSVIVEQLRGDKVRLGFDAPQEVRILRQEVWDAIQHAKGDDDD
jgi:carbon storage regulator